MNTNKITNFLFEIASMRRIRRAHSQVIKGVEENISDHSFRVAVIGMLLANLEKCDENKVLKMCLFHDVAEARTGDSNYINKQYDQLFEEEARKDQMNQLPFENEMLAVLDEYEKRKSTESKVSKDADLLDQMVLQQEHFYNDVENHKKWQDHTEKSLVTTSAKQIAKDIRTTNPFRWLYTLSEEKTKND